jgi:hypothetical protein
MTENPKHYAGQAKIPFGDVPAIVMAELGVAMHEGARKYGAYNYRRTAIRASDYYDAAQRHLKQWYELGEDVDPTCGISHITKALAALTVLRDAQINGMCKDDRPPVVNGDHWRELERVVQALRAKYPVEAPRVTGWPTDVIPLAPGKERRIFAPLSREALRTASDEAAQKVAEAHDRLVDRAFDRCNRFQLADVEGAKGSDYELPVAGLSR